METAVRSRTKMLRRAALGPGGESAKEARDLVQCTLWSWRLPDLVENALHVTSEFVANALIGGIFLLTISHDAAAKRVYIEVRDNRVGIPEPRRAADDDENGRGLVLVEALSDAWGYDEPTNTAWAQFNC